MPPLPHIPNCVRFDFTFSAGTTFGGFRLFWLYVSPSNPSGAQLASLAQWGGTSWNGTLGAQTPATTSLIEVKVTDLQSASAFTGIDTTTHQGTLAGGELPLSAAGLMNFTIGTRYRGGKPRAYLPIGSDTQTTDGRHWLGSFVTSVNNSYSTFVTQIEAFTGGITMGPQCVVHYYKGFEPNPSGSVWATKNRPKVDPNAANTVDTVTGHALNPIIGSQRRRLRSTS
jgi:hypothetical protein